MFAAIPFALVGSGVYVLVLTPEVITQYVEYSSSHTTGIALLLFGLIAGLMAALIWEMSR